MQMIRDFVDLVLHRWPWDGDKIRLYNRKFPVRDDGLWVPSDEFIGEFFIKAEGGAIRVPGSHPYAAIRRDLPKWSNRHGSWEYFYIDGHGS